MNAVYPLGKGSEWNNNEIKYSIALLRKYAAWITDIYTVGVAVEGAINIPFDETQHPAVNIWEKIYEACHDERISDPFFCINDDHYIIKPIQPDYPNYYAHLISEYDCKPVSLGGKIFQGMEHPYQRLVLRTLDVLGDGLFFNVHCPFIVHKQKFIDIFERYSDEIYTDVGLLVKTTYLHGEPGVQMNDYKTRTNETEQSILKHCEGRHVFSSGKHSKALESVLKQFLNE